ncbi:MAG: type II toxin-antitoxin system VapC family toxin [Geothrix sp.]|nr:type II toxin-antitoxin system VapC family toxin [Geothrix sp.]
MILYLDTSALVKLLRVELDSEAVWKAAENAKALASSTLARVEVHSAFARLLREGQPSEAIQTSLVEFEELWRGMAQVQMDRAVDAACGLCIKHPLRTLDAIHLASALLLREEGGLEVVFACADGRLRDAAAAEGFRLV